MIFPLLFRLIALNVTFTSAHYSNYLYNDCESSANSIKNDFGVDFGNADLYCADPTTNPVSVWDAEYKPANECIGNYDDYKRICYVSCAKNYAISVDGVSNKYNNAVIERAEFVCQKSSVDTSKYFWFFRVKTDKTSLRGHFQ